MAALWASATAANSAGGVPVRSIFETGGVQDRDWTTTLDGRTVHVMRTTPTASPGSDTDATSTPSISDDDLLAWASGLGPILDAHAAEHDRDGTWVHDSFEALRAAGMLALAVPAELGGKGATIRQVALVQRELARHCASTALAISMHQHATAFTVWRWRRELPGAEATLRRVAGNDTVLVSTGGGDLTHPRGEAIRVEGGYRVDGVKRFVSQSPVGSVMSTMFAFDDPSRGRRVLNMAIPFGDGVTVADDWDGMGMRGTGSNTVSISDVFVPDERVLADRAHGVVDPPLQVILSIAMPIISAVYLGIADSAAAASVDAIADRAHDPAMQRCVGLMSHRIRVAGWALDGALSVVGDDPAPSMETVAAVMAAKREIALAGIEVCDLAMDVAGGAAYRRGAIIERAYRDMRAVKNHPFTPEQTLTHAGRLALALPCDVVQA